MSRSNGTQDQQRRQFTPEEKATILRRHLADRVPVSHLCDEHHIQPTLFYLWQRQAFEQLSAALQGGRLKSFIDSSHVETNTYPCLAYDEWGVTCISWGHEAVWTHTALRSDAFTYDEVGNRTDRSAGIGTGNRLTAFDGYTLTYHDDGNLLTKTKGSFSGCVPGLVDKSGGASILER